MHETFGGSIVALAFETDSKKNDDSTLREWSSLIGIITAIVGNLLISFALNIQRYAHIRLDRDKLRRKSRKPLSKYGTQQADIAEEGAQPDLDAPAVDGRDEADQKRYHGQSNRGDGESGPVRQSLRSHGLTKLSRSETQEEENEVRTKSYLRSPYWWAGILLMTTGEAGNFLAYGFAPASIVAPLGVVALVSNCIIAPVLLKERFRHRDFWGVVVAAGGAVTVVLSAKTAETKMGPQDVWKAITRWEFETYLGITAGLMIILVWASGRYGNRTILIDLGLVALFGGYTALSTKGVASLLSDSLWRTLTFPISYLLIFVLISTAVLQIRYVNRALQRFSSTQVIPTQFVLHTISVIVGSAVLYRDFESATAERVGKFVGGCLLTFLGVYLITGGRPNTSYGDNNESEDDGSQIALLDEEHDNMSIGDEDDQGTVTPMVSSTNGELFRQTSYRPINNNQSPPRTPIRYNSHASSTASDPFPVVHDNSETPLLINPWASSSTSRERPGHLPSRSYQDGSSNPALAADAQLQQLLDTPLERQSLISRNSISRMLPGPLLSPLPSSALNVIVADNLRKGVDSPSRRRKRLFGLRNSRSQKILNDLNDAAEAASSPLKSAPLTDDWPDIGVKGRSRSLSDTIGGFFKIKRGSRRKSKTRDVESNAQDDDRARPSTGED